LIVFAWLIDIDFDDDDEWHKKKFEKESFLSIKDDKNFIFL
jgi:hypothetical protein